MTATARHPASEPAGQPPDGDVAHTELGDVAQPDSGAAGESLIDRSAEKAEPTV
ncbi:MAG: hypothetical protein ACT4P1_01290 [Sporichthyaceae bacterium]